MKFSVNPSVFSSMIATPSVVAEKYLKLASGDQIKVLLAFLKSSTDEKYIENITALTGFSEQKATESLEFWASCGVLVCDKVKTSANNNEQKKVSRAVLSGKPTRSETIKMAANNKELKFLFDEIQAKFNKPITVAQMTTLVWLYDTYSLPVPVILMAAQYCINDGKTAFSYFEKVCVDWAENDILDVASAEKRINSLYLSKSAWRLVCSAFGIDERRPTAKEQTLADRWINEYCYNKDVIKYAYDKCVDATGKVSFPYIGKIIDKWHGAGLNSMDDIVRAESDDGKGGDGLDFMDDKASYDIEKVKKKFNDFDNMKW